MERASGARPGSEQEGNPISDEQMAREHAWVLAAQAGDRAAFGQLVEAYQAPIYNLTYRMLGNPQEAEDAAQEAFLRAYAKLASYDPARKFSNWLFSIASHHCIDCLRRRRARFVPLDDVPGLQGLVDDQPQPEATALAREEQRQVQQLLAQLPENYRLVVTLFYWYDLSCQEIGQVVGISEGAVKVRLHRGRKQLAELMRADEAQAEQAASIQPIPAGPRKEGREHALSGC